jgi:RHS repeat-associated protein
MSRVYADSGTASRTLDGGDALVATYQYDGRNRRVAKLLPATGGNFKRTDYYYNENWQVLEERYIASVSGTATAATAASRKMLWDARYIDAPVWQWAASACYYYTTDANMNVTTWVLSGGTGPYTRYEYDPYGLPRQLDAGTWNRTSSADVSKTETLYCGYRYDPETGLLQVRERYYHPTLGRWGQWDRIGYGDGLNLLAAVVSNPIRWADPTGLYVEVAAETDTRRGGDLVADVVAALRRICPCGHIEANRATMNVVAVENGTPVDRPYTMQVVTLSSPGQGQGMFCECYEEHSVGCTLLHDLLRSKARIRIGYENIENATAAPNFQYRRADGSLWASVDLIPVTWNPAFPGWGSARGLKDTRDGEIVSRNRDDAEANATAILAHELMHAWDFTHPGPGQMPKVPDGWAFDQVRWYLESRAVATENLVWEEITGRKGGRTHYGTTRVANPHERWLRECKCKEEMWDDLPWGGAWPGDEPVRTGFGAPTSQGAK